MMYPKADKARPGKRTPTADERRWLNAIADMGCIACRVDGHFGVPAEIHHIVSGGRRLGHLHSIPLCPGHHRDGAGIPGLVARHPWKARFEAQYGSEEYLLSLARELLEVTC